MQKFAKKLDNIVLKNSENFDFVKTCVKIFTMNFFGKTLSENCEKFKNI